MYRSIAHVLFSVAVLLLLAGGGTVAYRQWLASKAALAEASPSAPAQPVSDGEMPVRINQQARANLALTAQAMKPVTYWRTIEVPGVVIDRPGVSDRGIVAPVTGVITKIFSHPGETVELDAPLFTLRLTSESLHTSQRELFKAAREIEIAHEQRRRLDSLAQEGALAKSRIIEIDNQILRTNVNVEAYRQDLLTRGLSLNQVEAAAKGRFVTEITVRAPAEAALPRREVTLLASDEEEEPSPLPFKFEFQELEVSLGQQAEAGQVLCHLADHRTLLIEGRGFKDDMPLIQHAAEQGLAIEIEFEESKRGNWPPRAAKTTDSPHREHH